MAVFLFFLVTLNAWNHKEKFFIRIIFLRGLGNQWFQVARAGQSLPERMVGFPGAGKKAAANKKWGLCLIMK